MPALAGINICCGFTRVAEAQGSGADCASLAGRGATQAPPPKFPVVIPFTMRQNHVAITVCRAGKAFTFTLDTGAGSSNFDMNTAKDAGVTLGDGFRVGGAGTGSVAGARIVDAVEIPGAGLSIPLSAAIDYSGLAAASGTALEGLVGADFLSRYVVAVNYLKHTLTFYDRESFEYTGPGSVVPVTFSGPFIRIPADITLRDGSAISGTFLVDLGSGLPLALSTHYVIANRLKERLGSTVTRPGGRGVGGVSMVDVGRVAKLSIGSVTLPQVITMLHSETSGAFGNPALGDGNIGGDILRRFVVYLDYKRKQLILEPHEGFAEPFESDMSGLQLSIGADRTRYSVDYVVAKSPAADAGFMEGDVVTAVDGVAVTPALLDELRLRLRQPDQKLAFTVVRGSNTIVLRVVTRRIV